MASYFAGPAIVPSQHATAAPDNSAVATPSPAKSRDPRFSGSASTTVRHIARSFAAADATGDGDLVIPIDGVDATNVWILGRVVSVVNMEASVSFTLDDGTGKIALTRWIAEDIDAKEVAFVQNGIYLKVQVTLVGFQTKQYGFARAIRPVTNFNEVALHFIECIYLHLENVRQKMQGQFPRSIQANVSTYEMQAQVAHSIQTKSPAYMPFSGGAREHQVDFAPEVNHGRFLSSVQTNTPTHVPFSGGAREQQVHFTPQPNQFSAYPGTGGHQHDLQSMVLEVMQRPDILALENGVHVDEVARRLGMPSAQILATAQRLVNLACLCSTIDDYHFKSIK
ncbi:OB-fold nucleic acid binding domain containing protein [Zea mays]|uniref:Replication protein A 32 kDa subunit A n=1 Tax=Zea mays TaxID=4577 RepID=B7ZYD1_MAIZE|nr:OB-fold nucleic acid binding domain containing protein [Zea mays]ACL52930.1 unknown [Zea mays]AQK81294.1 Replication protein A 32 kDa subunit A [Zea mays]|eukprot:NP_001151380.2 OB-fold nucleic acid binding domain containing protein [Zea mays]